MKDPLYHVSTHNREKQQISLTLDVHVEEREDGLSQPKTIALKSSANGRASILWKKEMDI